jgi:hypothetical protein
MDGCALKCGSDEPLKRQTTGVNACSEAVLADISDFSIVTYERKPGQWRAAFTRRVRSGVYRADKMRSMVTPDDYASESEAELAAEKMIRKL